MDNLGAELKDKCKTVLPQKATLTALAEPTSTLDIWQMARGGHKNRPQSPLTLKLENRFEPLINLHRTEIVICADKNGQQRVIKRKRQESHDWEWNKGIKDI